MPVTAVVIAGNTVFGYAPDKKTDPEEAAKHIKNILEENRMSKITVKILNDYTPFLARVEGLNNIAQVEKEDAGSGKGKYAGLFKYFHVAKRCRG